MSYYYNTFLHNISFEEVLDRVSKRLNDEGFSIVSEIDIKETLKDKLNVDFKKYKILGACNPPAAYKALQTEDKIGTMLPCNIIVQERSPVSIEVTAIDPISSMPGKEYKSLENMAMDVHNKLKKVIDNL